MELREAGRNREGYRDEGEGKKDKEKGKEVKTGDQRGDMAENADSRES